MKALIWFLCIAVATILNELLGLVTGFRIGAFIFVPIVFFVSKKLCSNWDEYVNKKNTPVVPYKSRFSECQKCGYIAVFEKECPKCGYISFEEEK